MRLTTTLLITTLLAVAMLTGCAGPQPSASPEPAPAPVESRAVNVTVLGKVSGTSLNLQNYYLGVLDADAVDKLGLAARFAEQGVTLDPTQHSVVLLGLGEQPTAGFGADILGLQRKGSELFVQGTARAPKADAAVAQQITTPFCAVAVDKLPAGLSVRSDITSLMD